MKKVFTLFIILITIECGAQSINVPESLNITEGSKNLDDVSRNGFMVPVVGGKKDIAKAFQKFLSDEYKYDVKTKSKSVVGEDLLASSFSDKHFNLKAVIDENGSNSDLWYFVSFGTDIYVNSTDYPVETQKCKAILKSFVKSFYSGFINEDIGESTKEIEKSGKELLKINKTISGLEKSQAKEEKKKEKLEKSKVKLEEKARKLQESIDDNSKSISEQDASLTELKEKVTVESSTQGEIKSKLDEQKKTLSTLKEKLTKVQAY